MAVWNWLRGITTRRTSQPLGHRGEAAAASHLKRLGYKIVAIREQRHPFGEADIIAVDGRTLVFVEVKTRKNQRHGHPAAAVDVSKQKRLARFALSYLKRHELLGYAARFDVVAITWPDGHRPHIEHFRNAFEPPGRGCMFG